MQLLKGTVIGVADKGTEAKPWAIVAISSNTINRNGFIEPKLFELTVFGDNVKNGLHNAYRALKGVEVFAPFNVEYNEKYRELSYQLAGIPARLEEVRPVQSAPAAKAG